MRFISRSAGFKCFPIHGEVDRFTGLERKQGVIAAFTQGLPIEEWEYATARAHFSFPGGNLEDDGDSGGAPVDPTGRIAVYDTDVQAETFSWDAEKKQQVEEAMLKISKDSYGIDFIPVYKPATSIPWPSYDEFTSPEKIAAFAVEAGVNPQDVLAYERENKNRKTVIAAVEALEKPTVVAA